MYTYAASAPVLTELLKILDRNEIEYDPVMPSEEKMIGFLRTSLKPEEMLPFLEAARGCKVRIVPIRKVDIMNENVRHRIRANYADMGYVTDRGRKTIRSSASIKTVAIHYPN